MYGSIRFLSGVAALMLTAAACAPASTPPAAQPPAAQGSGAAAKTTNPKLQALIEAARKEGQLNLVWGENTAGGTAGAQRWADGFNKMYGLNVKVQFTPGPSMPDMAAKIAQEQQAGRPASSDVVLGSEAHVVSLMQSKTLEPVDWASWAEHIQDPELLATPDGIAVEMVTRTPGITYNTRKVAAHEVPTSLADLLKPQYKGRIASTPYAAMFDRLASPQLWGEARTVDYIRKLSEQTSGLLRCGELERIISGEFDILALDCGSYDVAKAKTQGAPVEHVIPTDSAALVYWYMGVPKNAANPNTAKLFINYVLSPEAQEMLYSSEFSDHHLVKGSKTGAMVKKLQDAGVTFANVDVAFVLSNDDRELSRIRTQLQNILAKK